MNSLSWFPAELRIPVWRRRFHRAAKLLAKCFAWGVVWAVTLLVLAVVVENWRGRRAWKSYVAEATAAGDSFDIAPLIPPPVPDDQNFGTAPIFKPFFDYTLEKVGNTAPEPRWRNSQKPERFKDMRWVIFPRTPTGRTAITYPEWRRGELMDLSVWQETFRKQQKADAPAHLRPGEELLSELSKWDADLSDLREANQRPLSRFPLRYEDAPSIFCLHYGFLQNAAIFLRMRELAELSLQQIDAAAADQALAFRLFTSLEGEPLLIALLVRISVLQISLPQLWEGLARRQWKDEQLAGFDQQLADTNLAEHFQRSIRWERNGLLIPSLDLLNRDRSLKLGKQLQSSTYHESKSWIPETPLWLRSWALWSAPSGWFEQNKVIGSKLLQQVVQCADSGAARFYPDRVRTVRETVSPLKDTKNPYAFFVGGTEYVSVVRRCAVAQATVNLARIAISLERQRLRHGRYPATLAMSDPDLLPVGKLIPNDPASGTPPHYVPRGDGFELYYDGWNCVDDGGNIQWRRHLPQPDEENGDWVWPVAKSQE